MASNFPQSIDSFANPVYTKIDGEDVVKAAHVNDLQEAVRATQEVVAGAGRTIGFSSTRFIAPNTSFKTCIESLDANLGAIFDEFDSHKNYVMPTDPVQHHANVIAITSVGNLSSTNVQDMAMELQGDIDSIMTGGVVAGVTLDDRYVKIVGAQTLAGPITISSDLTVNGDTILGQTGTSLIIDSDTTINGPLVLTSSLSTSGDILIDSGYKLADKTAINASYIQFGADKIEVASFKDVIVKLDADDATDGLSQSAKFSILNGLGSEVLSVNEFGNLVLLGSLTLDTIAVNSNLSIDDLVLTNNTVELTESNYHVQLDKTNISGTGRFFITQDGDTGNNLASPDLLLNLDETSTLITGIHKLKSSVQETGYFGLQTYSPNAGGTFFGYGVNFKHTMTNTPSSVVLTIDENINASNISIVDINRYGFFWKCDSVAVGPLTIRGTYATIGN